MYNTAKFLLHVHALYKIYKASVSSGCVKQAVPFIEYPKKMIEFDNQYLEGRESYSKKLVCYLKPYLK
jgi:hypothetical protein